MQVIVALSNLLFVVFFCAQETRALSRLHHQNIENTATTIHKNGVKKLYPDEQLNDFSQTDDQRQFHLQVENERNIMNLRNIEVPRNHDPFLRKQREFHRYKHSGHGILHKKNQKHEQHRSEQLNDLEEFKDYLSDDSQSTLQHEEWTDNWPVPHLREYSKTRELKELHDFVNHPTELKKMRISHQHVDDHPSDHPKHHIPHHKLHHHKHHHSPRGSSKPNHHKAIKHLNFASPHDFEWKRQDIDIPELQGFVLVDYDEEDFRSRGSDSAKVRSEIKPLSDDDLDAEVSIGGPIQQQGNNFKVGVEKFKEFDLTVLDVPSLEREMNRGTDDEQSNKLSYGHKSKQDKTLAVLDKNSVLSEMTEKSEMRPVSPTSAIDQHHISRRVGDSSHSVNNNIAGTLKNLHSISVSKDYEGALVTKKLLQKKVHISPSASKTSRSRREEGKLENFLSITLREIQINACQGYGKDICIKLICYKMVCKS